MPEMPGAHQGTVTRRRRGRSVNALAIQIAGAALAFILVAVLVVTSSRAAFVAQTGNTANTVSSAGISLSDDDGGSTAMFNNVTGLVPGGNVDRCITVTYTGTADPNPVVLYSSGTPSGTLAPYLDLAVDVGPAISDTFGGCAGFTASPTNVYTGTLDAFSTACTSYVSGRNTGWDPSATSPDSRTFRFRVSVQSNALAQNRTTTFGFTWEAQTP